MKKKSYIRKEKDGGTMYKVTDRELTDAFDFVYDQINVYENEAFHYQGVEKDKTREIFAQAKLGNFKNILKQLKNYQTVLEEIYKNDYEILG